MTMMILRFIIIYQEIYVLLFHSILSNILLHMLDVWEIDTLHLLVMISISVTFFTNFITVLSRLVFLLHSHLLILQLRNQSSYNMHFTLLDCSTRYIKQNWGQKSGNNSISPSFVISLFKWYLWEEGPSSTAWHY